MRDNTMKHPMKFVRSTKKTYRLLVVSMLLVSCLVLANQYMRLWRDTIFHSQDVSAFVLPNGIEVPTNRWLSKSALLAGHQSFSYVLTLSHDGHYEAPFHLSFEDSENDEYAKTVEPNGAVFEMLITSCTVSADGYTELNVTRGDLE